MHRMVVNTEQPLIEWVHSISIFPRIVFIYTKSVDGRIMMANISTEQSHGNEVYGNRADFEATIKICGRVV